MAVGGCGWVLTHICCLPWVFPTPPACRPFIPSAAGVCSSSPRVLGAVRPPLVLLMGLTMAGHPHHSDLLPLRYGYRSLGQERREGEEGKGANRPANTSMRNGPKMLGEGWGHGGGGVTASRPSKILVRLSGEGLERQRTVTTSRWIKDSAAEVAPKHTHWFSRQHDWNGVF